MKRVILLILVVISFIEIIQANNIKAVRDGNWSDPNSWDLNRVPTANDNVFIDCFSITMNLSTSAEVNALVVTNKDMQERISALILEDSASLTVNNQISLLSSYGEPYTGIGEANQVQLIARGNSRLRFYGQLHINRENAETTNPQIKVLIENSAKLIGRDIFVELHSQHNGNAITNFVLNDYAKLELENSYTVHAYQGNILKFELYHNAQIHFNNSLILHKKNDAEVNINFQSHAHSQIGGDLLMDSRSESNNLYRDISMRFASGVVHIYNDLKIATDNEYQKANIFLNNDATLLRVGNNIDMNSLHQEVVKVHMQDSSLIDMGGDLIRHNGNGRIIMEPRSTLVFSGANQTLPGNRDSQTGGEISTFENILLKNGSSGTIYVEQDLSISNRLSLDNTILDIAPNAKLILEEGAIIEGGSSNSYVDGKVEKRGASNSPSFLPLGDDGIYGPFELAPTSSGSIYRVEYHSDPPPIGLLPEPRGSINFTGEHYWEVERVMGTTPVDVVLHYDDAEKMMIESQELSVIMFMHESDSSYINGGNGGYTGGIGAQVSGSIQSDMMACPPPIGISIFTIGTSVSERPSLPVQLKNFYAKRRKTNNKLEWQTEVEMMFSYFEIQHSQNALSFNSLDKYTAKARQGLGAYYEHIHQTPPQGRNYYRLKMVDEDGSYAYSPMVTVYNHLEEDIQIQPNPIKEYFSITGFPTESKIATLELFDSSGQLLYQTEISLEAGIITLNASQLKIDFPGLYYLKISNEEFEETLKIFKTAHK